MASSLPQESRCSKMLEMFCANIIMPSIFLLFFFFFSFVRGPGKLLHADREVDVCVRVCDTFLGLNVGNHLLMISDVSCVFTFK